MVGLLRLIALPFVKKIKLVLIVGKRRHVLYRRHGPWTEGLKASMTQPSRWMRWC